MEPFSNTPDTRFLYLSRQHEEALAAILYGIENRKGFMLLAGEVGTGKTMLSRAIVSGLPEEVFVSVILNPMLSTTELLEAINDDFGNDMARGASGIKGELDALNRFLLAALEKGRNAVILIDEAQHLSFEAFEMLRMLSNLETEEAKLLQIVFIGQKELDEMLSREEFRQLSQRISVRYLLGGLSMEETVEYILHRLSIAGGDGYVQFEMPAIALVHSGSRGIPRLINSICDRALLEAYASGKRIITKKIVKTAIKDIMGELNARGVSAVRKKRLFSRSIWGR